jgi:hypothetical protein
VQGASLKLFIEGFRSTHVNSEIGIQTAKAVPAVGMSVVVAVLDWPFSR